MPCHVILTADIVVRQLRISVSVTDVEERDAPVPTSHRDIPGCRAEILAAIACRRDGLYRNVRFRPGVGSADYTTQVGSVLWSRWSRMANFFRDNYGAPEASSCAFIGPVRTGGAGDTQWRIDTASGVAATGDLIREACREFVELGIAEPELNEQGRSVGLVGYGVPHFTGDLAPYQGDINEVIAEEWGAHSLQLQPTFAYQVVPIELPVRDQLVGSDLPIIVTGNRHRKSVGALEFVLPVERQFASRQVAVVDLESTRDKEGNITGFLNREVKVVCASREDQAAMVFGLSSFGGVNEQGLNIPLNKSTAPYVLNTKSRAAVSAAGIWKG